MMLAIATEVKLQRQVFVSLEPARLHKNLLYCALKIQSCLRLLLVCCYFSLVKREFRLA